MPQRDNFWMLLSPATAKFWALQDMTKASQESGATRRRPGRMRRVARAVTKRAA